jgi:broad specificity phosphatase PhoE
VIVLVRHGRTEANARGLLLGRLDPPLDHEGTRQAGCLGGALAGLDVARIVTSPLQRCRTTAAAIADVLTDAEGKPIPVTVDEQWIEIDYGAFDGMPVADVAPETWAHWRQDVTWAPEGGESMAQLGARIRPACEALADEASERDVVVVTHVSPIKAAVAWVLGAPIDIAWRSQLSLASICRIDLTRRGPILTAFNELAPTPR